MLQLYNLGAIEGQVVANHTIFKINLPLIGPDELTLFKMIPMPAVINNTFITIHPSSSHLAVNAHQDQYYPLSEHDLSACTTIGGRRYLCTESHPIYRRGANISRCELNLLNNITSLSTCQLKTIDCSPVWIRIPNTNQWIFAVKNATLLNAVCDGQASIITIDGTGILKLLPTCIVKQDLVTLQGQNIFSSSTRVSYTRLSQVPSFTDVNHVARIHQYETNMTTHVMELQHLRNQLSIQQAELPTVLQHHNLRHTIMGSTGLLLVFAIIVYLFRQHLTKPCKNRATIPIPSPRTTTTESSSFTITV